MHEGFRLRLPIGRRYRDEAAHRSLIESREFESLFCAGSREGTVILSGGSEGEARNEWKVCRAD